MLRVPEDLLRHARELRRWQTDAERLLWMLLRGRRLAGFKFRRQKPLGRYVLDFYCAAKRLAIELDGGGHAEGRRASYDRRREDDLRGAEIRVLRFWNNQVLKETEAVLQSIWNELQAGEAPPPSPRPSPASGRGGRQRRAARSMIHGNV